MKILLDHNTPHGLINQLANHEVHTAERLGWETLRNGDLARLTARLGAVIYCIRQCNRF